jgi:hypothetical protein
MTNEGQDLSHTKDNYQAQNCPKHNQGIELGATVFQIFQTFATHKSEKAC